MPSPSGNPSRPNASGDAGTPGKPPAGEQPPGEQPQSGQRPGEQSSQGDQRRPGDDGWESSNELPGSPETRPGDGSERPGASESGASGRDRELEQALEVFDGQILSEREAILARRNETAGQRPLPEPPGRESGAQPESEAGSGSAPQGKPGLPAPPPKPPPNLPVPPDVADAQDDDVVCRQIREAAVAETDTDLREDLWDEYRRCREDR